MNYKEMENKRVLNVYSHRIGEILVTEFGLKELIKIEYLPKREDKDKVRKVYVFRNSPELLQMFKDYTYKEDFKETGEQI